MDLSDLAQKLIGLAVVFGSVILHEVAHGYTAWRLGDPTARMQGRITLNPLAHIDLFGTILLPLMLAFSPGHPPILGWAKPVPFNPAYFKNPKRDIMITGAAGPITNFLLALLGAAVLRLAGPFLSQDGMLFYVLAMFCVSNIFLGLFNLIPIPPLDGSRVAIGLMPDEWIGSYLKIERFGFLILFALLWTGWINDWFLNPVADFVIRLLL
jgi:Zn-dependent protease